VFKWPRVKEGTQSLELRASEFAMVLDGIDSTNDANGSRQLL